MSSPDREESIATIKKTQENIAVVIGTIFALTMCVYFFTYAMLVDKGLSGGLWTMGISSVLMLLILIKLKAVSFFLTRLLLGRRADLRDTFTKLSAADL
ncbi:MAG: hypothetical protein COW19_04880 [Zetaproteobacteria bacterium CG12_big_fil_rev_8_21_14_0_65_55_1124]|nr:MAG: hypothetical protein COT53_10960 [Zetaproteobacteria bacterium CG08_land_8_20_14_0_20_55_17]PIW43056.1 MAG: hypothetical protein COW19_04880 [Zetaproteobacteria bacterium CG12_big_fil_rev_8_21_14_0_65_55_1124]PIY51340.1 MAG: hypothetical protein COZ01_11425 [Zetaproteobacteria bacterium CG_4_10_14_0_8_um_filter_55_43]PIZ37982.1 MAG: hypothetical protein COY36_07630 [Zetaproteobacteria bacterium CG_4_10_14_0_2_um_filter_55_20]PJB81881.1 MAG: hypothetical protein CO089_02960 [Zetaproteoba